jgi:hypothetical protein
MQKTVLFSVLFLLVLQSNAQQVVERSFRPFIPNTIEISGTMTKLMERRNSFGASCTYGINTWIDAGLDFDYYHVKSGVASTNALFCGLIAKAHLITPFFPDYKLFDVYASVKPGWRFVNAVGFNQQSSRGNSFYCGFYGGLAANISRYFGIFFEYGFSNKLDIKLNQNIAVGLHVRIPGPKRFERSPK